MGCDGLAVGGVGGSLDWKHYFVKQEVVELGYFAN